MENALFIHFLSHLPGPLSFYTALENNTIFLQQFFRFRGGGISPPSPPPAGAHGQALKIVHLERISKALYNLFCICVRLNWDLNWEAQLSKIHKLLRKYFSNNCKFLLLSAGGGATPDSANVIYIKRFPGGLRGHPFIF